MPEQNMTGSFLITPEEIPIQVEPVAATDKKYGSLFGGGLDPITAGFNAVAAFFNFLSTTQGQRVCEDIINFDHAFIEKIHSLFNKLHDFIDKKA